MAIDSARLRRAGSFVGLINAVNSGLVVVKHWQSAVRACIGHRKAPSPSVKRTGHERGGLQHTSRADATTHETGIETEPD